MTLSEDRWLAERFGHPVVSLDPSTGQERLLADLEERLAAGGTASYQAKVPASEVSFVHALSANGFRVVSATITLRRPTPEGEHERPGPAIDAARPEQSDALIGLAEEGFTRDRFHLDPAIPNRIADRVKRDWLANCLAGARGEGVLVARDDDVPLGLLAVIAAEHGGERVRVIDLIAVAPASRGQGVGGALVQRFLEDSRGRCDHVRVGTQAANPEAIRFYEGMGFYVDDAAYDMHLHVGDPWGANAE